jgi:hypothetical protein
MSLAISLEMCKLSIALSKCAQAGVEEGAEGASTTRD